MVPLLYFLFFYYNTVNAGNTYLALKVQNTTFSSRFAAIIPESTPFGSEYPYISFRMDLTYPPQIKADTSILLFHYQNTNIKILNINGDWCCTQSAFNEGKCKSVGFFNIRGVYNWTNIENKYSIDETKSIVYWKDLTGYSFDPVTSVLTLEEKVQLNKTGIWYFFLANCNHSHPVDINGIITWKNPYGYLSGVLFPFLPMYFCISTSFFFLLVIWIFHMIKFRENLMGLQIVILAAITLSFIENTLWAFDYLNYNTSGNISDTINIFGALITSSKLTIIRTTILLVSLGFSITTPTLEKRTTIYVCILTAVYFISSTLEEYIWVVTTMNLQFPVILQIIVIIVSILTNFIYVFWVGYSLYNQTKSLSAEKQTEKLSMFRKLIIFLIVFLILSVVLFFFQVIFVSLNLRDEFWQFWWLWDAFWEFGYFFVLILIAVLWWPNENNKRYAYSTQLGDGEGEDNQFELPDHEEENTAFKKTKDNKEGQNLNFSDDEEDNDIGPNDNEL